MAHFHIAATKNTHFKSLHEKILKQRINTNYISKTSVNGIIEEMAIFCRNLIYNEIKQSGCFSALIDESKDKGKREERAFAVRYFHDNAVKERFLNLDKLTEFDAQTIMRHTKTQIECVRAGSNGAAVESIGADGASVM